MLKAALSGGYVNFGVMRLYGDDALENALGIFVKLLGSTRQRDLLVSCLLLSVLCALFETEMLWIFSVQKATSLLSGRFSALIKVSVDNIT